MSHIIVLASLALLILPGLAFILWVAPDAGDSALERFTLAIGLSLSLIPIVYLWSTWAGVPIRSAIVHLALGGCLIIVLALSRRVLAKTPSLTPNAVIWHLVIAASTALTFWLRVEQIRDLSLPVWVDSLHHTLLVRVSIEQGAAPLSLRPYLPVDGLTYHWGYHVAIATMAQAANLRTPEALPALILWSGQTLSALAVPAYAALAMRLWKRPIAGAAAGLVVGLASVMPAYYVSWGRYTLLTGMLMLPAVLLTLNTVRQQPKPRSIILLAILLAGLSLVHFVVFTLTLAACSALWLTHIGHMTGRQRLAVWLGSATIGALALTAPWIVLLASRALPGTGSSAMHIAGNAGYNALPLELLWAGTNRMLLALGGIGAMLALWQRRHAAAWLIIWCATAVLLANPVVVGLPYLSFITNEMLTITMFAPLALLIAGGAAAIDAWGAHTDWRRYAWWIGGLALAAGIALWGTNHWRSIVRPDTVLAGRADLAAIAWVAHATPPEARFVVGTTGWLYDVDRGADGGWWLLPLAGRQVSTPPVIYNYGAPADVAAIKRDTSWLRNHGSSASAEELAAFMRERGYTHVYTSKRPGALRAETLHGTPWFACVYDEGGVAIFRLQQ